MVDRGHRCEPSLRQSGIEAHSPDLGADGDSHLTTDAARGRSGRLAGGCDLSLVHAPRMPRRPLSAIITQYVPRLVSDGVQRSTILGRVRLRWSRRADLLPAGHQRCERRRRDAAEPSISLPAGHQRGDRRRRTAPNGRFRCPRVTIRDPRRVVAACAAPGFIQTLATARSDGSPGRIRSRCRTRRARPHRVCGVGCGWSSATGGRRRRSRRPRPHPAPVGG